MGHISKGYLGGDWLAEFGDKLVAERLRLDAQQIFPNNPELVADIEAVHAELSRSTRIKKPKADPLWIAVENVNATIPSKTRLGQNNIADPNAYLSSEDDEILELSNPIVPLTIAPEDLLTDDDIKMPIFTVGTVVSEEKFTIHREGEKQKGFSTRQTPVSPVVKSKPQKDKTAAPKPLNLISAGLTLAAAITAPTISVWDKIAEQNTNTRIQTPVPAPDGSKFRCSDSAPMIWHGDNGDQILTGDICRRVLEAIPGVNITRQYSDKITVTGLENGNYAFQLEGKKPITVKTVTYKALINGWLIGGGQTQNPVALASYFAQFNQESGMGRFGKAFNGSALGVGMVMPSTAPELLKRYGKEHGLEDETDTVDALRRQKNGSYRAVSRTKIGNEIFHDVYSNPTHNVTMVTRKNTDDARTLQALVKSGDCALPGGRKTINGGEVYLGHLLGPGQLKRDKDGDISVRDGKVQASGALRIICNLKDHYNEPVKDFVTSAAYHSNRSMFELRVPALDKNGNPKKDKKGHTITKLDHVYTMGEFHDRLYDVLGFSHRALPDLKDWKVGDRIPEGTVNTQNYATSFNANSEFVAGEQTFAINRNVTVVDQNGEVVKDAQGKAKTVFIETLSGNILAGKKTPLPKCSDDWKACISNFIWGNSSSNPEYRAYITYTTPTSLNAALEVPRVYAIQ